jgi:glycosyltransferase involved in cell wall biosynthesis
LVQRGAAVTVWTTDVLDAARRLAEHREVVDGIVVRRFANVSNRLAYHLQIYLPRGLRAYARDHVSSFDVVHLHAHRHVLNAVVAAAARATGIPYVLTGHGTVPAIERRIGVKRLVDALGARKILARAAYCIAVSNAEVAHFRAAGVPQSRIRVVANGMGLGEFATLPERGGFRRARGLGDAPVILFVGKITPRKGVDVLLRAVARMPADVQLVIAGNFMMPAEPLHHLARELGMAHRVHWVGFLAVDDKLAAYVDADVVAYPSVHEIFGLVPFEALMCGTPVVVCDDSGCGEVVQAAGGGLLVPYGDAGALAGAMRALLDDPALRQRCVEEGRRYVRAHLGWDHIAERMLTLYGEAAGVAGGHVAKAVGPRGEVR